MDEGLQVFTCNKKIGTNYESCSKLYKKDLALFAKPQNKNRRYMFSTEERFKRFFNDKLLENTLLNSLNFWYVKYLFENVGIVVKHLIYVILTLLIFPIHTLILICIMFIQSFYNFTPFKTFCTYESRNLFEIKFHDKQEILVPNDYRKTYKSHMKELHSKLNLDILTEEEKISPKDNLSCATYTKSRKSHVLCNHNYQNQCMKSLHTQNSETFGKEDRRVIKRNIFNKKNKKSSVMKLVYSSGNKSPKKIAKYIYAAQMQKSLSPSAGTAGSYQSLNILKTNSLKRRYKAINKIKRKSRKLIYSIVQAELTPAEKLTQSFKCIVLCFYHALVLNVLLLLPYFLHIILNQNVKKRQKLVDELWSSIPSRFQFVLETVAYFKEWREMTIFSIIDDLLDQKNKDSFKSKSSELKFNLDLKPKKNFSQNLIFSTARKISTGIFNSSRLFFLYIFKLVKCFPHTQLIYSLINPYLFSFKNFFTILVTLFKLSLLMFVHIWAVMAYKYASVSSYLLKLPCKLLSLRPFKYNNGKEVG